jgi:microsomal dipeptidase-like Zn-dependent dipeptidase
VARLAGHDHVGIGRDPCGSGLMRIGLEDVSRLSERSAELIRRAGATLTSSSFQVANTIEELDGKR